MSSSTLFLQWQADANGSVGALQSRLNRPQIPRHKNIRQWARFEIFMEVKSQVEIFWVVTPW